MTPEDLDRHAQILWHYHHLDQPVIAADVIIGLGSYDLRVAEHCAALWHQGIADIILFTGAEGNWTRGVFRQPEALVFRDIAVAQGVPPDKILIEDQAKNIGDNIALSKKLLQDREIKKRAFRD